MPTEETTQINIEDLDAKKKALEEIENQRLSLQQEIQMIETQKIIEYVEEQERTPKKDRMTRRQIQKQSGLVNGALKEIRKTLADNKKTFDLSDFFDVIFQKIIDSVEDTTTKRELAFLKMKVDVIIQENNL